MNRFTVSPRIYRGLPQKTQAAIYEIACMYNDNQILTIWCVENQTDVLLEEWQEMGENAHQENHTAELISSKEIGDWFERELRP